MRLFIIKKRWLTKNFRKKMNIYSELLRKGGKIIGLFTNVNETKFLVWWMNVKQISWWSSQENAPDLSWSREVLNALKNYFLQATKILGPPHLPSYVYQRQHVWRKYNELWWQEWWID